MEEVRWQVVFNSPTNAYKPYGRVSSYLSEKRARRWGTKVIALAVYSKIQEQIYRKTAVNWTFEGQDEDEIPQAERPLYKFMEQLDQETDSCDDYWNSEWRMFSNEEDYEESELHAESCTTKKKITDWFVKQFMEYYQSNVITDELVKHRWSTQLTFEIKEIRVKTKQ